MKVIAKKAYVGTGGHIFCMVMLTLVTLIPMYALLSVKEDLSGQIGMIFYFVIYLALMAFLAYRLIDYYKTPKEILLYDGEYVISFKGKFLPTEIEDVSYAFAKGRVHRYGPYSLYSWGTLRLTIGSKTITYRYVEDLEKTYDYLMKLKTEM